MNLRKLISIIAHQMRDKNGRFKFHGPHPHGGSGMSLFSPSDSKRTGFQSRPLVEEEVPPRPASNEPGIRFKKDKLIPPHFKNATEERIWMGKTHYLANDKKKNELALEAEKVIAAEIKGVRPEGKQHHTHPIDIYQHDHKVLIEVKTRQEGKNPKVTVHQPSLVRKLVDYKQHMRKSRKYTPHLVAVDCQLPSGMVSKDPKTFNYYYRTGFGSYNHENMFYCGKGEAGLKKLNQVLAGGWRKLEFNKTHPKVPGVSLWEYEMHVKMKTFEMDGIPGLDEKFRKAGEFKRLKKMEKYKDDLAWLQAMAIGGMSRYGFRICVR